jgi:hypothetical protein
VAKSQRKEEVNAYGLPPYETPRRKGFCGYLARAVALAKLAGTFEVEYAGEKFWNWQNESNFNWSGFPRLAARARKTA